MSRSARRVRSGKHVWLCVSRDSSPHATPYHARSPAHGLTRQTEKRRHPPPTQTRWQSSAFSPVRRAHTSSDQIDRRLYAARRSDQSGGDQESTDHSSDQTAHRSVATRRHPVPHQPDGEICHLRSPGRCLTDWQKDHRRHLWRDRQTWRRSIFWQRSYQSRQISRLYGETYRQAARRC